MLNKPSFEVIGTRNPIIKIKFNDIVFNVQTIGDVHLGKIFRTGVPKNSLHLREQNLFQSFTELLNKSDINLVVIMGDLFDKVNVSNEYLNKTIDLFKETCISNPDINYYVLSGNHDLSKDTSKISTFKLLEKYFKQDSSFILENLHFVSSYTEPLYIEVVDSLLYFSHYDPFSSLDDYQISSDVFSQGSLKIAFGHWDTIAYDSDKFINRLIPNTILSNFDVIFTGHEHKPNFKLFPKNQRNVPVYLTGSIQPFAHGEEIPEDMLLYVTTTIPRLKAHLDKNADYFKYSNVRILYNKDDLFPEDFPCLSRTYKLISDLKEVISEDLETHGETISFQKIMLNVFQNHLNPDNAIFIKEIERMFIEKSYD